MAKRKTTKAKEPQVDKEEMNIYLRLEKRADGQFMPIFLIPTTNDLFLAWVKREDEHPSEWMLKNIKYISSMRQKYGENATTFEVCEKSKFVRKATPLDILMYTNMSIEQVRDIFNTHKTRIITEGQGKN